MSAWLDNLMSDLRPQKRERAPFAGAPLSGDDWLEQLLMTAQPMDVVYPTIDTRGKAPIATPDDSLPETVWNGLKAAPLTLGALPLTGIGMVAEGLGNAADATAETFPENSWRRNVMETARDAAFGAADISTGALKAFAPSPTQGWTSAHASGLLGSLGGLASMVHADRVADNLIDESEKLANKNPVPAEFSWEYFTNPNGLRSDLGQLTGSMAAIAPFFVAANTPVGRVVTPAVRALGGNALERFLLGRGITAATAQRVPQAITNALTYGLTSAPAEGMMEGGHTRREALQQGLSDEEATRRSIEVAAANIPTLMATNSLEGLAMFAPILRAAKGSKLATAAQIAGRGLVNSAQEQTEEALQQGIQDWAMNREFGIAPWNWTSAQWDAASHVKYPAALMGGAGGIYHAIRRPAETPAENPASTETSTPEKISTPVEDETTKNLLAQFAEEKRRSSEDPTEVEFFDRMFTGKGKFRNTPENRAAILKNFGDEFSAWRKQIETPAETQSADKFLSNPKLFDDARNLLANLREENSGAALELQAAIQAGDASTIEKFLRQYNESPTPVETPAPEKISPPAETSTPEKISTPAEETPRYSSPLANAVQKFWNFPSTKLETPEAQKIYSLFTDWNAQGETSKPRELVDELKQLMTEDESAPLPQLIEQARSKIETAKPVQPQVKRTNSAEMAAKVLEIIPTDSFITEDEILDRIDDLEPSDLSDIMLKLELNGSVQERVGSFKRTNSEQQSPQISQETLQEQTQPQPQTQSSQISPHEDTRDAFDLLPEVGELNDVESDETSAQSPQSVSETPKTVIFRRNDKTSPDIPAGRKAIKEAPAGTKIRTLLGQNTETNFAVGEKNIQMLDENGQPIGQTYTRNSENMRKIFGSSGVQEIELTYPQEANQNATTQTTQTEENPHAEENSNQDAQPRQTSPQEVTPETNTQRAIEDIINQTRAEAYKILDVENHPHIKKRIDTIFAESRRNDKKDAEQLREKVLSLAHNIRDNNLFAKADFQAIAEDWAELKYSDYDKYGRKVFDLSVKAENGEVSYEDALKQIKEWRFGEKAKPTRKRKQSTKDTLHAKLKTDTHPHLKAWLDGKIKEAATPDGKQVRAYLKRLAQMDLTDTALDNAEENLKQVTEAHEKKKRELYSSGIKQEIISGYDNAYRERTGALKFNYPNSKYLELKQKISQMSDKKLQDEANELLDSFDTDWTKELPAVAKIESLIERDKNSSTEKSESDREAEIEKIISDATEEGHKILELDKYPEATDWFDSQVERGRRKRNITTVEAAEDYAKTIVEVAKSFRADKYYPKGILGGMLTRWLKPKTNNGDTALPEKYQATRDEAEYLIDQTVDGRLTLDDAYAKMKSLLEENSAPEPQSESKPKKSQGKWHTVMSSPSREELQKFMRKEFGNDTLTIQDDGKVFDGLHKRNSNYTVRTKNGRWQLGKYEDDSEPAPKPKAETQKPEEDLSYEERLDRKAETYFVKHKNIYMDDTPYFGAAIKASAFPDIGGTNSFIKSTEKALDEIVESYGGRPASRIRNSIKNYGFETAEKRDKFVRAVMQEGLLDTERDHRISLIREREKKIKADAARQAEKDKILTDAKNEAYKILEADKYPETKSWVDRQIQNVIRKKNIETVAEYEEFAKDVIESVRSYKAKHNPARNAALEALYQWRDGRPTDSRGRISRADSQKYDKAEDIIRQADSGELSPDEAYAEMKHFLRTGRRTKSKPAPNSNESIGKMNAALREASEKIINDAAKNPDVARALEQLGATVKNGKVAFPDDKTFQACVNLVNSGIVKSSQSGNVDTTIKNFVDPQDLNSFQRAFATFAKEIGVPIVFFRGAKNFHGAHANGISFYNADANFSHEWVYWHEFGHWLKNNQPELFGKLSDAANVTDEQIAEKKKSRTELSDEELREEIICDAMGDVARRAGIFQQFAKKNQSLIQRLMSWAKSTLDRFTDWFHTRERGLTTAQRAKMYDAFGKIARQIEDADGNKIFRYNSRTHEVELATGEKLPETKNTAVTVTGDEFGEYSDIKDLRKKAKDFYKNTLRGTSVRNPILGKVELTDDVIMFTNIGLNKMGSTSAQREKLLLVKHLPELIESADRVSAEENYKNKRNASQYSYLHSTALVDGKIRDVNITIFSDVNGNRYYNHNLDSAAKTVEGLPVHLAQAPQSKGGIPTIGKPSEKTISQTERTDKPKYSLDAGDNSNESFVQRIRNKISALFDDTSPSKQRDKKITELLSKISGYRIAFGHFANGDISVDDFQKIIRSRHAYDWEKLLPVVGKKIAGNLKLDATDEMGNYIAEWILTGALNNTSAEANEFAKAMRENPATFETLDAVREIFKEISDMTPLERIKSKIVSDRKKTFLQRLGFKGGLKEEFVDDLAPLEKMVDDAIKVSKPEVAKLIRQMIDPYKTARLLRGKGGIADVMLYGEAKDIGKIRAALQEQYPNVKFERFTTLEMIIDEAGGVKNLADFEAFCVAKQMKEIHEYNRKNPDKKLVTTFSEKDCDDMIKSGEEKFGAAQKDLVRFSKTLLSMQYDSGLLTKAKFFSYLNAWKNYIPLARVFEENEDYNFFDSMQERTGSKREIYSPIQKVIANTTRFIAQAERNKAKLEIATLARCGGLGGIIAEVDSAKPNVDNIVYFKENGRLKKLETPDVSIARAVNSLQKPSDSVWVAKVFKGIMGFMRAAYTASNPDFAVGNIFRDFADAFIHNKFSSANPLTAMLDVWRRGLLGVIRRDADYFDWIVNGGSQTSFVSEDVDYAERAISDLTRGTRKQRYLSKNFFSQVLDDIQKLAEYSEYATRLNTYKTAKDKLAAQNGGKATITDKRLAVLESRDASVDFARSGRSMRVVNKVLLFSNAAVQGLALDFKTFNPKKFKTAEGRKELFAAAFRMMTMSVLPAALMFALNHSDDDRRKKYKNRPDWEKDTYWIFGDGFRIPKGMDLGIRLFSALTDEFFAHVVDDDPFNSKRIAKTIRDAAPSITATIITPAFEAYTNYSIFRDAPIVPLREQKLPANLQFGAGTSPAAKFIGEKLNYSPRKIDYLISGYLGFMGRFFSGGTDELPMVRRFIFDPYKNPRIVKEYYEALDEQTKLFNEYKLTKKPPDGYDKALHGRLKSAQESMRKFSKLERKILEAPKLSADERTTKLHELEQRRVALCEKIFKRAR